MENTQLAVLNTAEIETKLQESAAQIIESYNANTNSVVKATNAAINILNCIVNENGEADVKLMTPEIDAMMNEYLSKIIKTATNIKTNEDLALGGFKVISEQFLLLRKKVDIKNIESFAYQIQKIRNEYAAFIAAEIKKQEQIAAEKLAKETAIINLKKNITDLLNNFFIGYLTEKKSNYNQRFNNITLESFETEIAWFKKKNFAFTEKALVNFTCNHLQNKYCTGDEFSALFVETVNANFARLQETYVAEMLILCESVLEREFSKKQELEKIAEFEREEKLRIAEEQRIAEERKTANAAEKLRLDAIVLENKRKQDKDNELQRKENEARILREKAEKEQLEKESKELAEKQKIESESNAAGQHALALFSDISEIPNNSDAPKIKEGVEIEILNPAAYAELFLNWFKKEAKYMEAADLRKKLDFLVKYAEKEANRKVNPIEFKSNMIIWKPVFKSQIKK